MCSGVGEVATLMKGKYNKASKKKKHTHMLLCFLAFGTGGEQQPMQVQQMIKWPP